MASNSTHPVSGSQVELKIVGRVLNTLGVVFLSICVALSAALYEDVSAVARTAIGLAIAAAMVAGGEALSRRRQSNWWFPTTLMAAGYSLAYFFTYSTFYVPGLHMMETPYAAWGLGLILGAIGTWHGSINKQLRWFTSVFTLVVTGHALYHALSSAAIVAPFGLSIKVAALGCFVGMIWCAGLSAIYSRLETRFKGDSDSIEEVANWWLHRILHEGYFVFAALNAMALPLFLADFEQAPLWWALQAPILLAITWRRGNFFKHSVVGLIWLAAAGTLLHNSFNHVVALPIVLAVPVSGLAIGLAYRYLRSNWAPMLKVAGYCAYLYAGIAVALLAPYLQVGFWDAMPFWLIQGLVLCGLGLALRDKFVHDAGTVVGLVGLALFGLQYATWTWALAGPVVVCAYALSVSYSRIRRKGGWEQTPFLHELGIGQTVTTDVAQKLENLWSWVGCLTLFGASFLLVDQASTVTWWSIEALVLIVLGFVAQKQGFRLQGLLAFGLATAKLVVLDLNGGVFAWAPAAALTLYNAYQFGVLGASTLAASFLYFREEQKLELTLASEQHTDIAPPVTPPATDVRDDSQE